MDNKYLSFKKHTAMLTEIGATQFKKEYLNEFPEPKWFPFVYIVALEYRHAEYLARHNRIPKNCWKYVDRHWDLHGARGKIVFYGPWYRNIHNQRIADMVRNYGDHFEIIELGDGVDFATKPDITVISSPCGNCGVYRMITKGIMEKCPNCGDDETDLNEEIDVP